MPAGKGTYGKKVGRPSKAAKAKGMKAAMKTGMKAMGMKGKKRKPTKRK